MRNSLFPRSVVMSSDDDCPVVSDLYAGIDSCRRLVILVDHIDYDLPEYNCWTAARLTPGQTLRLSRRLKVGIASLPAFIASCMDEWNEIVNPTCSEVADCFKQITECLLDEGAQFRILRKTAAHGYICC